MLQHCVALKIVVAIVSRNITLKISHSNQQGLLQFEIYIHLESVYLVHRTCKPRRAHKGVLEMPSPLH